MCAMRGLGTAPKPEAGEMIVEIIAKPPPKPEAGEMIIEIIAKPPPNPEGGGNDCRNNLQATTQPRRGEMIIETSDHPHPKTPKG